MQLSALSVRLLTLLALALPALASAQYHRPGPRGPQPHWPRPHDPREIDVEVARVNTYIDRRKEVNVTRELGLRRDLRQGDKLLSLTVVASSSTRSNLVLKLNGRRIDSAPLGYYDQRVKFRLPRDLSPRDLLTLGTRGSAYVVKIKAKLLEEPDYHRPLPRRPRRHRPIPPPMYRRVVQVDLDRSFISNNEFPLSHLVRGVYAINPRAAVASVTFTVSGRGSVRLATFGNKLEKKKFRGLLSERVTIEVPGYATINDVMVTFKGLTNLDSLIIAMK